jgi:hypothetical protein
MPQMIRPSLAALALCATLAPASAQTPAASLYEGISPMATCTDLDPPRIACLKQFPKTPSTTRVLMRNINCYIYSTTRMDGLNLGVTVTAGGPTKKKIYIPIRGETIVNGIYTYTINEPIYFYIGSDRYPEVSISFASYGTSSADCSITGDYVK